MAETSYNQKSANTSNYCNTSRVNMEWGKPKQPNKFEYYHTERGSNIIQPQKSLLELTKGGPAERRNLGNHFLGLNMGRGNSIIRPGKSTHHQILEHTNCGSVVGEAWATNFQAYALYNRGRSPSIIYLESLSRVDLLWGRSESSIGGSI